MERDFRPESVESDGQLAQAAGWKVSGHAPAPQAQGIAQRRQKNAEYDIFEEKFEEALREKGFMIFDISSTNLHSDKKRGVIAARKAGYPKKMLLRFCDYCSGAEVEKISLVADALDVDFCLMVYKEVDGRALRSSLGRKVELISRGFSNEFLELM